MHWFCILMGGCVCLECFAVLCSPSLYADECFCCGFYSCIRQNSCNYSLWMPSSVFQKDLLFYDSILVCIAGWKEGGVGRGNTFVWHVYCNKQCDCLSSCLCGFTHHIVEHFNNQTPLMELLLKTTLSHTHDQNKRLLPSVHLSKYLFTQSLEKINKSK